MTTKPGIAKAIKISAKEVNVFYGEKQALNEVSIDIEDRSVTAFTVSYTHLTLPTILLV